MRSFLTPVAVIAIAAAAAPAWAGPQLLLEPSDEMVRQAAHLVRANIALGRYADGSSVQPETDAERALPLLPFDLERQTVRRAVLTGELQACGADWQSESFAPYMARMRANDRLTPRQLVYVGMLHGFVQGQTHSALAAHVRSCSKGRIEDLRTLAAQPVPLP